MADTHSGAEEQRRRRAALAAGLPLVRIQHGPLPAGKLTRDELTILKGLSRPLRPSEILEYLGVPRVAGARAIASLMRAGYIDIATDDNVHALSLTDGSSEEEDVSDRTLEDYEVPAAVLAARARSAGRAMTFQIPENIPERPDAGMRLDSEVGFGAEHIVRSPNEGFVLPAPLPPSMAAETAPQDVRMSAVRPRDATPSPSPLGRMGSTPVVAGNQRRWLLWAAIAAGALGGLFLLLGLFGVL